MRGLVCFLLLLPAMQSFCQDDEIPTYHNKLLGFSKVKEPLIRADLAAFTLGGLDESVGKKPLAYLPVTSYGDNFLELSSQDIHVRITSGTFNQNSHKIQRYDQYVVRIDNKPFYGVNGQMPRKTIASMAVMIGTDSVNIPSSAYEDLYEPRFCASNGGGGKVSCNTRVFLSADGHRVYIYMLNSSGKGGYEVTWVIEDKKYLRRVIDYDF